MLILNESGWLLDGQPTNLASWFPTGRIATLNANINTPIQIQVSDVILIGNGVTVSGTQSQSGIMIENRNNIQIMQVVIDGFARGLNISNAANLLGVDIVVRNCALGFSLTSCQLCSLIQCTASLSIDYGLRMVNSDGNKVISSVFENQIGAGSGFRAGIGLETSSNNSFYDNRFVDNESGIQCSYTCDNNGIIDNTFMNNGVSLVLFSGPSNNGILNNSFTEDRVIGLNLFERSNNNTVKDNQFINSDTGIGVFERSNSNSILTNSIVTIQNGIINDESDFTRIIGNTISSRDAEGIMIVSGDNLEIRDNIVTGTLAQ